MGEAGQAGTLVIEGDFTQLAAGVLNIVIGGLQPGVGFSQLIVTGHAVLGGTIAVTLANGFVPATEPDPDEFAVLVFESYEGTFDQESIDLGNGVWLDIEIDPSGAVVLVAREE
ncbi:MAG: hypothetical protein L0Y70_10055 [Gemmataceae bacterium]|nr:hypothetical protein [Gemmataceae bacterium]